MEIFFVQRGESQINEKYLFAKSIRVTKAHAADVSNIMGVSGHIGVVSWKTGINLANSVSISIGISLAIAIVTQSISTMADMSDHTWVVKTTIKGSVVKGKSSVNLANGIWFSLGLTLAKMMESMIARVDCSVANGSIS